MKVSGRRWVVPVVVVVVAALFGAAGVIVFVGPRPGRAAGASVRLEAAGRPGSDPFTTSVTIGKTAAFPGTIHAITTHQVAHLASDSNTGGLRAAGNAPGLYGGTGNNAVCDPHQLAGFLTHNPSKAAAWAGVLGIRPSQIAGYVATLTPVVLTTDTRVTNHGYRNGAATTLQSVLQAGTAVLVDARGIPRVKCGCGNPLTPPTSTPIGSTTGTPWPTYQRTTVTTITPAPQPIKTLTLTNLDTGTTYQQPTGTRTGTTPRQPTDTNSGTWLAMTWKAGSPGQFTGKASASTDGGGTWTALPDGCSDFCSDASGLAYGAGKWVGLEGRYGNGTVKVSGDGGKTWTSTEVGNIGAVAYGNGRWVALGASSARAAVEYTSTDGTHWTQVAATGLPGGNFLGGVDWHWNSVAFGGGSWVALETDCATQCHESVMFTSTNGTDWDQSGQPFNDGAVAAYGSGQWVVAANAGHGYENGQSVVDPQSAAVVSISRDLTHWSKTSVPAWGEYLAFGGGTWLLAAYPEGLSASSATRLFSSADAHTWRAAVTLDGTLGALAFGGS